MSSSDVSDFSMRDTETIVYTNPETEVNWGLWTLFAGATLFLGARIWCKYDRRNGLWYDDYILIASWLVLMTNNIILVDEWATGYNDGNWDDRMHILINITSCFTLIGQAWSKTAFGVTLLRMANRPQKYILWFCIASMNLYMFFKVLFQWAKYCDRDDYQQWYRLNFCINYHFEQNFKIGGNVYNIIMDFFFALIPWWITWPLEMRRSEKIGLCVTLSLGMIVAVVAAIRTGWKDTADMHKHDASYMWRNGMSSIWYSSEVAGTIIVQCIPIIRPFIRDIHTTFTSKRLDDTETTRSTARRSTTDGKRSSAFITQQHDFKRGGVDVIALDDITEEPRADEKVSYPASTISDFDHVTPIETTGPLFGDSWRLPEEDSPRTQSDRYSAQSSPRRERHSGSAQDSFWFDLESEEERGLSPPPRPRKQ